VYLRRYQVHVFLSKTTPAAAPQEFGWVASRHEEFVLQPGAGSVWGPMAVWHDGVIRYDLHSTVPVNTAVLDGAIYDSDHQVAWLMFQTAAMGTTIQGAPPNPIRCFSPSVIATQQSCEMGKEMMIIYLTSSANESGSAVTI
jgi:hypothetical protein